VRVALTIAGSDPTGGAGLQADLQVFRAFGVHGAGVITALTVQDTAKVHRVLPVFPNVVLEQLRVLLADLTPHAVKIGMLATDDVARSVLLGLRELDRAPAPVPIVVDPVLQASDGTRLLEPRARGVLEELIGRSAIVTPNLLEAREITGCDVSSEEGIEAAGCAFVMNLGAAAALVKGGHRDGPPDDLFVVREGGSASLTWLRGERIEVGRVHGTGCALASAIAAGLARGVELRAAVERARRFVAKSLREAEAVGKMARLLAYL
jgi:hydroxymethylpyrimidine/phosphomethylpyrimidine kinase